MNDKQYRFSEIVTTISLLPDDSNEVEGEELRLPNDTDGLDEDMFRALMVQAMRETDEWRAKFYATLLNTTMNAVMEREAILEQDLWAFTLASNIAWASRAGSETLKALGLLAHTAEGAGLQIPAYAYSFFRDPQGAGDLSDKDPYIFLGGDE
jgi:hypothetical protein